MIKITDKELFKQLNNLSEIKADSAWKKRNREVLLKQLYGTETKEGKKKSQFFYFFELPFVLVKDMSQPTLAAILIFLFLGSSGLASVKMAEKTKPGDSLYIAKIVSEKTQYALTFNEKAKAQLGIEFAANRLEEINKVLAEGNGQERDKNVETLISSYKKQINDVKTRISKISPIINSNKPSDQVSSDNDNMVFSANFNKDNAGIEISEPSVPEKQQPEIKPIEVKEEQSTSTATAVDNQTASSTTTASEPIKTADILEQAKQLLDDDKYSDTLIKLEEADKSVDVVAQSEPKEEIDASATSTLQ